MSCPSTPTIPRRFLRPESSEGCGAALLGGGTSLKLWLQPYRYLIMEIDFSYSKLGLFLPEVKISEIGLCTAGKGLTILKKFLNETY